MVLVAIIVGAVLYFVLPLRQAVDVVARAELTDLADNALQRIGREVRAALPNSVRTTTAGTSAFIEFLPVRTAGRYRAEPSGGGCDAAADASGSDELAFGEPDACFKSIGALQDAAAITVNDWIVLNNYGAGFAGQDAYAGVSNRARVASSTAQAGRHRITMASTTFQADLHDSLGKRFFVVAGNAAGPEPVTYECDSAAQTLTRRWGYPLAAAQPAAVAAFSGANAALLASGVTACTFDYTANALAPQVGLLTLRLTLSRPRSDGSAETISLFHAVHVSNIP